MHLRPVFRSDTDLEDAVQVVHQPGLAHDCQAEASFDRCPAAGHVPQQRF